MKKIFVILAVLALALLLGEVLLSWSISRTAAKPAKPNGINADRTKANSSVKLAHNG